MTQDPNVSIANVQAMTFKMVKKLHLRPEKWHTQILKIHSSAPNGQIDPGPFSLLFLAFDRPQKPPNLKLYTIKVIVKLSRILVNCVPILSEG